MPQATAILNYLGRVHNLIPSDPLLATNGEILSEHATRDFWTMQMRDAMRSTAPDRKEKVHKAVKAHLVPFMEKVAQRLNPHFKFLCGNELTIYDFTVAGYFTNMICNPNAQEAQIWAEYYAKGPERVKRYVEEFQKEMHGYLS